MDKENRLILQITTLLVVIVAVISIFGMILAKDTPEIWQGEIECTRIKVSGKLLGRIEKYYVQEGDMIKQGDTLVLVNSPETDALMESASAMEDAAHYQSLKVDAGTRSQIVSSLKEVWDAAKAQAQLAENTSTRIGRLYADSVVTLQRKEEADALHKSAEAAAAAARYQYEMALEGAQIEDRESAKALVDAAKGNVNQVGALLKDSRLVSPADGIVSEIYPAEGELVMPGGTIMELLVLKSSHVVLNIREDKLTHFLKGKRFTGKIPALENTGIEFEVYYTAPLGSYATWQSSKQSNSYDLKTFEIKAKPVGDAQIASELRPGMSVIVENVQK